MSEESPSVRNNPINNNGSTVISNNNSSNIKIINNSPATNNNTANSSNVTTASSSTSSSATRRRSVNPSAASATPSNKHHHSNSGSSSNFPSISISTKEISSNTTTGSISRATVQIQPTSLSRFRSIRGRASTKDNNSHRGSISSAETSLISPSTVVQSPSETSTPVISAPPSEVQSRSTSPVSGNSIPSQQSRSSSPVSASHLSNQSANVNHASHNALLPNISVVTANLPALPPQGKSLHSPFSSRSHSNSLTSPFQGFHNASTANSANLSSRSNTLSGAETVPSAANLSQSGSSLGSLRSPLVKTLNISSISSSATNSPNVSPTNSARRLNLNSAVAHLSSAPLQSVAPWALGGAQNGPNNAQNFSLPLGVIGKDGCFIRYYNYGARSGISAPSLLFLHGFCCDSSYFSRQFSHFAPKYHCIAVDLAGHGNSSANRKNWLIETLAEDIKLVVKHANLEKIVIIAHSLSGAIAMHAATLLGNRILGILGLDCLFSTKFDSQISQINDLNSAMKANFSEAVRGMMSSAFPRHVEPFLRETLLEDMCSNNGCVAPLISAHLQFNFTRYFEVLRCPITSLSWGFHNKIAEQSEIIKNLAQDYKYVDLGDIGHFMQLTNAEEINKIIENFVLSCTPTCPSPNGSTSSMVSNLSSLSTISTFTNVSNSSASASPIPQPRNISLSLSSSYTNRAHSIPKIDLDAAAASLLSTLHGSHTFHHTNNSNPAPHSSREHHRESQLTNLHSNLLREHSASVLSVNTKEKTGLTHSHREINSAASKEIHLHSAESANSTSNYIAPLSSSSVTNSPLSAPVTPPVITTSPRFSMTNNSSTATSLPSASVLSSSASSPALAAGFSLGLSASSLLLSNQTGPQQLPTIQYSTTIQPNKAAQQRNQQRHTVSAFKLVQSALQNSALGNNSNFNANNNASATISSLLSHPPATNNSNNTSSISIASSNSTTLRVSSHRSYSPLSNVSINSAVSNSLLSDDYNTVEAEPSLERLELDGAQSEAEIELDTELISENEEINNEQSKNSSINPITGSAANH
jgi:pimeloyl-ACP methyl ester carboxylesterase